MDRPSIVLGLGNPGTRYRGTRHNMGFRVVDCVAARWGAKLAVSRELKGWTAEVRGPGGRVVLAKPRTYMNRSGRTAVALCARYNEDPRGVLVVYDDADLELGRMRLRPGGGSGGHKGMRSIIDSLRTDQFPRLRLGVRGAERGEAELSDYVLLPFEREEEPIAAEVVHHAADAVEASVERGIETAMNAINARFGSRDRDGPGPAEES